jgi:methylglutaconyl-CoA hydratase
MSGIRVDRDGAFARVTLDRPEVRNALNANLIGELRAAFQALSNEGPDSLRGVVLAGAGSAFCAGADVDWMRAAAGLGIADNERDAAALHAMLVSVDRCPAPVIARVHGAALGGGMGLCTVADVVVAAADTTFGFTETKLGIIPAVISPFVLAKVGESHARALFASGQRFEAERALRIGLVHEVVVDEAALDARVDELLGELRSAGPTAARAAKALVRELRALGPDEARDHTIRHIAQQRTSAEGQEGLGAFLEKRPPSWSSED